MEARIVEPESRVQIPCGIIIFTDVIGECLIPSLDSQLWAYSKTVLGGNRSSRRRTLKSIQPGATGWGFSDVSNNTVLPDIISYGLLSLSRHHTLVCSGMVELVRDSCCGSVQTISNITTYAIHLGVLGNVIIDFRWTSFISLSLTINFI